MQSSKSQLQIKIFLKPNKGKVFLTLFLFLLIFFGSLLICPPDPYFYLDPDPLTRLCQNLSRINWITIILVLYLISSMVIHLLNGREINAKSEN